MTTVTISYHDEGLYLTGVTNGHIVYSALYNGDPICSQRENGVEVSQLAIAAYAKAPKPKRLVDWNGDTATETIIDPEQPFYGILA